MVEVHKFIESLLEKHPWLDTNEEYELDPGFNYESAKNEYKTV